MKWIRILTAVVAFAGLSANAQAGIFGFGGGGCKSCGCAEDCQPECCKPTIARPCTTNVYTYQRKCSDIKPPCCDTGCGDSCAPECCAPAGCCEEVCEPACAAPCAPECAAPCEPACAAPSECCEDSCAPSCAVPCEPECAAPCAPSCAAPNECCPSGCAEGCDICCDDDPCEIAQLIYDSMTACYAKDRRKAIHRLGDRYDCVCHPEIMNAFIYGLNDADEDVRSKSADEIGDQLRKNDCCCTPEIVSALTAALGDCDRAVRRQAEEALEACGYEVVDGCCDECGDTCGDGCAPIETVPAVPAIPSEDAETEGEEVKAETSTVVPSALPPAETQAAAPAKKKKSRRGRSTLAGLLGFIR